MGKPSAPAPPNYAAAAQAQGTANVDAARTSSKLSNPNITNPYGSQTISYGVNGDPDQAQVTQSLNPTQQGLLDQQNAISGKYGSLAKSALQGVQESGVGTQLDTSNLPASPTAGQAGWNNAYNSIMERNQPFMDRQENMQKTQLANQGIYPGSDAYNNAMMDMTQQQNNFALGAQGQATQQQAAQFGMDSTASAQALSQAIATRDLPLSEASILAGGSGATVPQFQSYSPTQAAPAPIMQGVNNQYQGALTQYGQQSANYNNMMSGLFSIGAAGAGAMKMP